MPPTTAALYAAGGSRGGVAGAAVAAPVQNRELQAPTPTGTMAEARAEQSLLHAKLAALRREVDSLGSDREPAGGDCRAPSPQPVPSQPSRSPRSVGGRPVPHAAWGEAISEASRRADAEERTFELAALREQLAALESTLLERDATIEGLERHIRELQALLDKAMQEPQQAGLWQGRYEEAQRRGDARELALRELRLEGEGKNKEIALFQQYLRKLEDEARIRDEQRTRLLKDAEQSREQLEAAQGARIRLESQLRDLEDGFARCVGRVTCARAAGVVPVSLGDDKAVARFAVLRAYERGEGAVLELFEEPDSPWELAALDLSPAGPAGGARAAAAVQGGALLLEARAGGGEAKLHCTGEEDLAKWSGALRLLGLLAESGA